MKICHIIPHLGGGVKTVLLGWAKRTSIADKHIFICLGYSDQFVIDECKKHNIEHYQDTYNNFDLINEKVKEADIVIIHYWNFPLLSAMLIQNELPECRLIVWNHSSCLHAPYILPQKIIDMADKVIFTSPISMKGREDSKDIDKFGVIWSTGGVEKYKDIEFKKHDTLNFLYIGTLDFSKIDPWYIYNCAKIIKKFPNSHFTLCGIGNDSEYLKEEVKRYKLDSYFTFTGYVSNIEDYIAESDIFLYLLNSTQFGTGEQVLGEIMAAGLIPIVKDNPCEMQIVQNGYNGYISYGDIDLLESCIKGIQLDSPYKKYLSDNAKRTAIKKYSIDFMIEEWYHLFMTVISYPKKKRKFESTLDYPLGIKSFLESIDENSSLSESMRNILFRRFDTLSHMIICSLINTNSYQWSSENKGSIKQYLTYFPEDIHLQKLQKFIAEGI